MAPPSPPPPPPPPLSSLPPTLPARALNEEERSDAGNVTQMEAEVEMETEAENSASEKTV